jgi:hypothetical protein
MSNRPTISRVRIAFLGVAVVAAIALVPRSAAGQSAPPASGKKASAHGACGPDHPYVEVSGFWSDLHRDGSSVVAAAKAASLVLVGTPSSLRTVVAKRRAGDTVLTKATFAQPLILKSPAGGPASGAGAVSVTFPGGTALVAGLCTQDTGPLLRKGALYLVFSTARPDGGYFAWNAYPVNPKTGEVGPSWQGGFTRAGHTRHIDSLTIEIRAVAANEGAKGGSQ